MDLNDLLAREQTEIIRSETAVCRSTHHSHDGLARAYGAIIASRGFPHQPYRQKWIAE